MCSETAAGAAVAESSDSSRCSGASVVACEACVSRLETASGCVTGAFEPCLAS